MNSDQVWTLAKKLVVAFGGILIEHGYVSSTTWSEIVGAAAIIAPIVVSLVEQMEGPKLEKAVAVVNTALAAGEAAHTSNVYGAPTVTAVTPAGKIVS